MMKNIVVKRFICAVFAVFAFLFLNVDLYGQIILSDNYCEDNAATFQSVSILMKEGTKIIVIARNGNKEKSNSYSEIRLDVFRNFLRNERGVFAIGKRAKGNPQVEIYVNGKLELIFEVKNREKLKVGNCGN